MRFTCLLLHWITCAVCVCVCIFRMCVCLLYFRFPRFSGFLLHLYSLILRIYYSMSHALCLSLVCFFCLKCIFHCRTQFILCSEFQVTLRPICVYVVSVQMLNSVFLSFLKWQMKNNNNIHSNIRHRWQNYHVPDKVLLHSAAAIETIAWEYKCVSMYKFVRWQK